MSMNAQTIDRAEIMRQVHALPKDKWQDLIKEMMKRIGKVHPSAVTQVLFANRVGIPLGIFSQDKLSCLEAIVKYLRESKSMKLGSIATLLNRDNRTIWSTYSNAVRKMPEPLSSEGEEMVASLIAKRSLSTLEHVVCFAKSLGKTNHEVALLLHLDDRTIWSVYDKIKKKRAVEVGGEMP